MGVFKTVTLSLETHKYFRHYLNSSCVFLCIHECNNKGHELAVYVCLVNKNGSEILPVLSLVVQYF